MKAGKVYLVGAGPGDPNLITQKGLECLAKADVIIYDRLIDKQLLQSASPAAARIHVGKTAEHHTKPQHEINRLLVKKAKEGKNVVRLKGGDPFVLGRGGEEAEVLAYSRIPFEVVPGVSSATAVPAYAGIPVTHRGLASSFAVITGHKDPNKTNSNINWEKLATAVDSLVFLMGMQNLPEIVAELLQYGRFPDTPVAVIKDGTRPQQKTVVSTLKDVVGRVKEHQLGPPAVIVVGDVVRLRGKLRWFDNRPLFGKRILVTRARHQVKTLSRLLSERGAQPVELPAIDIKRVSDTTEVDDAISGLARYHWIIFTSVNGVEAFFGRLHSLKLDARNLHNLKVGAIGPATAKSIEQKGIIPDYCPAVYTSEGLLAGLRSRNILGQRFLLPRADIADKELTKGLIQLGAEVHEIVTYQTIPLVNTISRARELILSGEIDIIIFTSSSTVTNLLSVFDRKNSMVGKAKIACIGPRTSNTATKAGLKVDIIAREHTVLGMVAAIEEYFSKKESE